MISFGDFKNRFFGAKCVIFGNGPSLTHELVECINRIGVYSFAANGFCLIFEKTDFRPDAVCMSNHDAIRKYGTQYPASTLKFFKSKWRSKSRLKSNIENVYELPFACSHDKGRHGAAFIKDGNFTLDPSKENFCGDTVLLDFAVPIAFYMGFMEIYLCGVDCDYSKGYFSPDYKVSADDKYKGMVNDDYSIAIPAYRFVKEFLARHKRKLYKLTESKKIDFIETVSLEKAFIKR